jgi:DNA-binding transcriptional LysR family regulator
MEDLNLDMDVLRTLLAARRLGTFGNAARAVARSRSAVSQQVRRLEDQIGQRLFRKVGRGRVPTDAGEVVLAYAQRILELNDEAVVAVRARALEGVVRLGLPADLAESWLPAVLGRFRRAHPGVRVEVVVDRNRLLLERLDANALDLVLALGSAARPGAVELAEVPRVWIGPASSTLARAPGEPLPLVLFEAPCFFREAALAALDRAGIPWLIAFVSPSLHGVWAAVEAGLGVTVRTAIGLPDGVKVVGRGLPRLEGPPLALCVHDAGRTLGPAAVHLRSILVEEVTRELQQRVGIAARQRHPPRRAGSERRSGKRRRSR